MRAKDVSILFTDSGSGPRSSSIISQGNIDQIINFKPLERKIILINVVNTHVWVFLVRFGVWKPMSINIDSKYKYGCCGWLCSNRVYGF